MFSFEMFFNKMQRFSEEKIKNVVYAKWIEYSIMLIVISLLIWDLLNVVIIRINIILYYFLFILFILTLCLFINGRRAGIAITANRIVYVKFKYIGYREKEIYEVPFTNIKYITIKKILFLNYLNMSFISNEGKLERVRLIFSNFMIGPGAHSFKENSKEIYTKLKEIQKVVDRGDF